MVDKIKRNWYLINFAAGIVDIAIGVLEYSLSNWILLACMAICATISFITGIWFIRKSKVR